MGHVIRPAPNNICVKLTLRYFGGGERVSIKRVHRVPSSTPHSAPPRTATSPKLPPAPSPSSRHANSSLGAYDRRRGVREAGAHATAVRTPPPCRQSTLPPTPPPTPDPGRAARTPRGGAARGPTGRRSLCVQEGDGQTSLREQLSCARVRARGLPGRDPPGGRGWGARRQQSLGGTSLGPVALTSRAAPPSSAAAAASSR